MTDSTRSEIFEGFRDCLPVLVAVAFFGMLFGATAVNNGMTFWQATGASAAILAGASQFVLLDLYGQKVPVWSVLLAVFAVNFRHVLYSASIGRFLKSFTGFQKYFGFFFLTDPSFAAGEQRASIKTLTPAYFFGYALPFYPLWVGTTMIGAWVGNLIEDPKALGMDMLLSIYFLALLMGFRHRSGWLAIVLTSGVVSVILYRTLGSPWHITLGALPGIVLAAVLAKSAETEISND